MTASTTGPTVASSPEPSPVGVASRAVRRTLAIAVAILLVTELIVRLVHTALAVPVAWPQPELQKKFTQIEALAHSPKRPDVVLVGDSGMDAAGDPDGLEALDPGLRVYNASVAGAVLPEVADWTTKIVVPRLRPKLVVIGLSSNELNPHALGASSTVNYEKSRVVRAASGTGNPVDLADTWLRHWSMLYRYRTVLRDPFAGDTPTSTFDPLLTSSGHDLAFADEAYLQKGGPVQAQQVLAGVKAALQDFSVSPVNVKILEEMIRSLRHRGIEVLLIALPVTPVEVSLHPAGQADYQLAMDSFAATAERTSIVFRQPGIWPTSIFADPIHLNAAGTAQFTAYLAGLLRARRSGP